jgi:hypothetical protein
LVRSSDRVRVHLAELQLQAGKLKLAEGLLRPVQESGDPEVQWRLAEILASQGRAAEAASHLDIARRTFETLLARHALAFADHAAEFYLSAGANAPRAFELALANLSNRPTLRAFALAQQAALAAGAESSAHELGARAQAKWGHTKAFPHSRPIEQDQLEARS